MNSAINKRCPMCGIIKNRVKEFGTIIGSFGEEKTKAYCKECYPLFNQKAAAKGRQKRDPFYTPFN